MSRLSFGSIKEGSDLDESFEKKRRVDPSGFYNMNSKIIDEIS